MAEPQDENRADAPLPRDAAPAATRVGRFDRLRKVGDRVPTRWFAAIGTGIFLAATAGFGGLADASADPIPQIEPNEKHTNSQLRLSVERAVIFDEFPETGVTAGPGERVLAVVVEVENVWTETLPTTPGYSVSDAIRLDALPNDAPDGVARYDDGTTSPRLQPGIPVTVVVAWAVPAETYAGAGEVELRIFDETAWTGQLVTAGTTWGDARLAATVVVPLRDADADADADTDTDTDPGVDE